MRICAVICCANSTYTIGRWKQTVCTIHNCKYVSVDCDCPKPFKLIPFPIDKDRRRAWSALLNRKEATDRKGHGKNWVPNMDSRVCSRHFVDREPTERNPDPSLHLGYTQSQAKKTRKLPKERAMLTEATTSRETAPVVTTLPATSASDHEAYCAKCDCVPDCSCQGCLKKHTEILKLQHEMTCLNVRASVETQSKVNVTLCDKFLNSDRQTRIYTGLPARQTFDDLFTYLQPKAEKMRYWVGRKNVVSTSVKRKFKSSPKKSGPRRKLSHKDELLLVLMKLRLGLTNQLLSDMCGIAITTCSHIFNTWIKMLAVELKPLVFWPERDLIRSAMPQTLRATFPNLRCTIDCTEIYIERPRHLELQALTWSDYKKHNTAKILIGIAPNGMISFLSKACGGRTSDQHITREFGFLDLIDPKDVILADRGFTIQEDLLFRRATLYIPPPSSGLQQQSHVDVLKTKKIANARIHVERAINRLKWFTILKTVLPITLVPLIDDIIVVCSALCNLLPPLVS